MENFNMLILNPDWITNGIYRIINLSFKEHKHRLTTLKGTEILKNDKRYKYPHDKVAYLFKLMRLYELAFFKDTDNIFVPGILPKDRPDGLPTFDDARDRLTMSFVVEKALPPSITARIIVQRSEEIFDEKLLWRKGAVLKYKGSDDTIARIIEDSRSITVSVKGTEKTAYIASLRKTIKAIFDDYKVIKPDLLYEVLLPEKPENSELPSLLEKEKPLMLPEKTIDVYAKKETPYLEPLTERLLSLLETAIAYRVGDIVTKNFYGTYKKEEKNMEIQKITDSIIGNGNNGVIHSPNAIVGSVVNQRLPATVTEEQYKHILQKLEEFMESEKAGKLTDSEFRVAQTELSKARKEGCEKGWERILSIAASIAGIGAFILSLL
jgi:hypothetical protein